MGEKSGRSGRPRVFSEDREVYEDGEFLGFW